MRIEDNTLSSPEKLENITNNSEFEQRVNIPLRNEELSRNKYDNYPPQYIEKERNLKENYEGRYENELVRDRGVEYTRAPERIVENRMQEPNEYQIPQPKYQESQSYENKSSNESQPQTYKNPVDYSTRTEPQFIMYRGDYLPEKEEIVNKKLPKKKNTSSSDDEEVKLISGPRKRINDDLEGVIPIVAIKGKPATPKISQTKEKKNDVEHIETDLVLKKVSSLPAKNDEVKIGTGIFDMYNEINNLGLENVEIKPLPRSKPRLNTNKSANEHKENSKSINIVSEESCKNNVIASGENKTHFSPRNSWGNDSKTEKGSTNEKKNILSNIAVRPQLKNTQAKPKYVERPEIVPDDPEAGNNKASVQPIKAQDIPIKKNNKPVKEFKEVNPQIKPQGNDKDWDDWDD